MLRAARDPRLIARVTRRTPLYYASGRDEAHDRPAHVRSASSLTVWRGAIAVVSDDASFVAQVDPATGLCAAIALAASADGRRQFDARRGNKARKLDLESAFVLDGALIGLGSDSGLAIRRQAAIVDGAGPRLVALPRLYAALHQPILGSGRLNLEGDTVSGARLVLGNRGGDCGADGVPTCDAITELPLDAIRALLTDPARAAIPPIHWRPLHLDGLDGTALRLTELEAWHGALLYAATAEATRSAYDDGAVVGSAIGILAGEAARWAPVTDGAGAPLRDKLEGLVHLGDQLYAATDADDPDRASELLELTLEGPWRLGL